VRREEAITLRLRHKLLKRLSQESQSVEPSLQQPFVPE
jgi:hypothetical protein